MRNDDAAQLNVIEAIMVGVIVFVAVAMTAVFRLPTSPGAFQQAELERIGSDAMQALLAKQPDPGADCNVVGACPFQSELERVISLALDYNGLGPDVNPIADFFDQALPEGSFYVLYFSNGEGTRALHPTDREPPSSDVVVAHAVMGPSWTKWGAERGREQFYLRPWEIHHFPAAADIASITDSLGRTEDEDNVAHDVWFNTYAEDTQTLKRVPRDVPFGTYQVCIGGECDRFFAVVPSGVAGPGSLTNASDTDPFNVVKPFPGAGGTELSDHIKLYDNRLYLDLTDDNVVNTGDMRITFFPEDEDPPAGDETVKYASGSYVAAGDADASGSPAYSAYTPHVRYLNHDDEAGLTHGDAWYLDTSNDGLLTGDDYRLSRYGIYPMGAKISDGTGPTETLNEAYSAEHLGLRLLYADLDGGNDRDLDEPVYLDVDLGASDGLLDTYDVHITPRGEATLRYLYDIRLVVWFGI